MPMVLCRHWRCLKPKFLMEQEQDSSTHCGERSARPPCAAGPSVFLVLNHSCSRLALSADGTSALPALRCERELKASVHEMKAEADTNLEEVISLEERYQLDTYKKMRIVADRGEGVWIYARNGERYLDLYGGHAVAATGHCHPHVVKAIKEQAEKLLFYSNLVYSEARARAAEKLVSLAPDVLTKAFFCNSGTEANENAMRMARMTTDRQNIITFSGGFPRRTRRAISARVPCKCRGTRQSNLD